jgi:toxin ParE1/3/4
MAELALAFRRKAEADLDDILTFSVTRFGPEVAAAYTAGLISACEKLRDFPEMASIVPTIRRPTRCLIHRSHRIFYRLEPERILIVRILHQSRATPTAL